MDHKRLAPAFFLLVHDAFTGKLAVSRDLACCGLVAVQLADLMIRGHLDIVGDRVGTTEREVADDEIARFVLEGVSTQPTEHNVRTWTDALGDPLYELVARHLVDTSVVRRERVRRLLTTQPVFPAVDVLPASRPQLLMQEMIRVPGSFDLAGAVTVATVLTLGIEEVFDVRPAEDLRPAIVDNLPSSLRALIRGLEGAVAAVSLTVRR